MTTKTRIAAAALAGTMLAGVVAVPAIAQSNSGFANSREQATEMMNRIAQERGYEDVAFVEQKKRHIEAYTTDGEGNRVEIKVDRYGNLDTIEVEYSWAQPTIGQPASEDEVRASLQEAGYEMLFLKDRDDDEYEIMARNARGDVVELEVSLSGQVLKSEFKAQEFGAGFDEDRGPRGERGDDRRDRDERNDRDDRRDREDDRRS